MAEQIAGSKRAVVYLRVSTPSQVKTDYDPEGISIPAQREACQRKAAQLGVEVVEEYVEPGRTATSIFKRVAFQAMMERIETNRDVDYVIVYKLSRLNRNRIDDALVVLSLRQCNVTLASATEHIDASPTGQLTHGILASVNEFRSAEDGIDIKYKMGTKARNGGTIGKARLGYLNQRDRSEGRNIGIVVVDPERAPLIRMAFALYATGSYTLEELSDALADRGLRTRPGRYAAGPVSKSKLANMLSDRYYLGYITYQGEEFAGRHPRLVSPELFEEVQAVREQRSGAGIRHRRYHHYLKGSLWCGKCHAAGRTSRMIIQRSIGRGGGEYFYFFCRGRQEGTCDTHYLNMEATEEAVARHYCHLRFAPEFIEAVRNKVTETSNDEAKASELLRQHLARELARLDRQEENLLDLAADGDLASGKVRTRLKRIEQQRRSLQEQMSTSGTRLEAGAKHVRAALDLLHDPERLYRQAGPDERHLLNGAIFERLYVFEDRITDQVYRPPFDELVGAHKVCVGTTNERTVDDTSGAGLLATALYGGGSSRTAMVEVSGLEPPTSTLRTWRSTS